MLERGQLAFISHFNKCCIFWPMYFSQQLNGMATLPLNWQAHRNLNLRDFPGSTSGVMAEDKSWAQLVYSNICVLFMTSDSVSPVLYQTSSLQLNTTINTNKLTRGIINLQISRWLWFLGEKLSRSHPKKDAPKKHPRHGGGWGVGVTEGSREGSSRSWPPRCTARARTVDAGGSPEGRTAEIDEAAPHLCKQSWAPWDGALEPTELWVRSLPAEPLSLDSRCALTVTSQSEPTIKYSYQMTAGSVTAVMTKDWNRNSKYGHCCSLGKVNTHTHPHKHSPLTSQDAIMPVGHRHPYIFFTMSK